MSILQVKNLFKTYGKDDNLTKAVDGVDLAVEEGEFVAIVGASGSGKSTLLHLIGGVDKATSGEILVDGKNIAEYRSDELAIYRREKVGIIYQFYNLIPVLTVKENITLPVDLAGRKPDQKRVEKLLKDLGLSERADFLPNQLSGGQQQRVAIGRALFAEPKLILADEPTGNLDKKSSDDIVRLLKEINEKYHQTIIIVTHDQSIAEQASRVITFSDGKIIDDTRTSTVKATDEVLEEEIETLEEVEAENEDSIEA